MNSLAGLLLGTAPEQLPHVEHVTRLQSRQDPASGLVPEFPSHGMPDAGPLTFGAGPATYHVLSVGYALDLLGSSFSHPISAVSGMPADSLPESLKQLPWQKNTWGAGAWIDAWGTATYWNLAQTAKDGVTGTGQQRIHFSAGCWPTPMLSLEFGEIPVKEHCCKSSTATTA